MLPISVGVGCQWMCSHKDPASMMLRPVETTRVCARDSIMSRLPSVLCIGFNQMGKIPTLVLSSFKNVKSSADLGAQYFSYL